ncbi:hypothetical protein ACNTMW_25325 [Planosporangium sp. 12N6]|uniref:hypothetical protein n=1 Tax=Planosporangium spinosum TaxID=3402278 RepID=UPI003CEC4CC1
MGDRDDLDDLGVGLPPPANLPRRAVVSGEIVKIEEAYPRAVAVGPGLIAAVLCGATVTRLFTALLAAVLRTRAGAGDGRGWKALRQGPEFRVTPIWIRDTDGMFVELEVHGYLSGRALRRRDRVRVTAHRQNRPHLPMRAHRIENLTIGRIVVPRRPTVWTHLGPGLLLQAAAGLVGVALLVACVWVGG